MMKSNEKTFSTGEFAKLLEVNKDTLLYYDKIELFKPAGTFDNGYRYYMFDQFDQFVAIHSLRAVDLPIKELKKYFSSPNVEDLQQLAIQQHEKVAKEIQKLQDIQQFLERTVVLTKEIEQVVLGEVLIKSLPAEPVVYSEEKIDWSKSMEEMYAQSTPFSKKLGVKSTAAYGVVYPKEEFLTSVYFKELESDAFSYMFCHTKDTSAVMKPAGEYAIIYHKGSYEEIIKTYEVLLNFLKHTQFELDGDIHEEYLLHSIATKEEKNYITKISVKVKSQENFDELP
ncbi:Multidrug-efflux transporter 1 regulator [Solibacillus isronensis B3W22]|uniref:Multidrug-efflux transporter 1 regulator n=1 Tax=Solibacillus isronensis B3W22 TaxID=1224748 RepID=K1KXF4_9BACL|nr:GyrI-like domain-containing protein [Solibacillus isronensis]AMO85377.1 MerR family transcriptional regulator [Solibacillus silvestris]EKB44597.1 Multidrug-efflux transporter 1 regulator [Solibacillus isronensis B3W22]